MKVRMLTHIGGTRNGESWPSIGGEIDLPDLEGADMCAAGYAEPVAAAPEPEKRPARAPREKR